jgi:uncharacterized membrane protein
MKTLLIQGLILRAFLPNAGYLKREINFLKKGQNEKPSSLLTNFNVMPIFF